MSLRLYMDAHIHYAITNGLRQRGVDVLTAQEDGSDALSDHELLDRASVLDRVLFSMDADLRREAVLRQRRAEPFAGVICADQLGISIGQCIADLQLIALVYDPPDIAGQVEYLPL